MHRVLKVLEIHMKIQVIDRLLGRLMIQPILLCEVHIERNAPVLLDWQLDNTDVKGRVVAVAPESQESVDGHVSAGFETVDDLVIASEEVG